MLSNEIHPSLHPNCHHQINYTKLCLNCPPPPPFERRVWHYRRAKEDLIRRAIHDFNWEEELDRLSDSPEEQVSLFDRIIMNIMINFIPFVDKIFKPKDPPWVTRASKVLLHRYKRKYKKFSMKGCPSEEKGQIDELRAEYLT